jgi:histidyl-tRNA synthetase
MSVKVSIPKGTRDFLPEEVKKRNYIFSTIRDVFQLFGFEPIETPSFELSQTLMGKYGEEGDRLIFRILNSGEKMKKADIEALSVENLPRFANSLSEKALRYDLTVPFARFVVQHQNELSFPFKRYQIQPVWRADRPQHGRYQEFYQCDADVVGSDSLLCELELIQIFDLVLNRLSLPGFTIKLNNRKILSGIAEVCAERENLVDLVTAIDKLDKIGEEGVIQELIAKGISNTAIQKISPLFSFSGNNLDKLNFLKEFLKTSEVGLKGVEELSYLIDTVEKFPLSRGVLELDITLARGLNYYTGAILEVKAHNVKMGSICGGGRYDDLTGLFGLKGLSGVGISFGADRIYDVLTELNLFPAKLVNEKKFLFINFEASTYFHVAPLMSALRTRGIVCEFYPTQAKLQKQFKYANDKNISYVVIIGEEEIKNNSVALKNMVTGEQQILSHSELLKL